MKVKTGTVIKDLEDNDVVNGRKSVQGQPPIWYTVKSALCELIQMEGLPVEPDERLRLFDVGIRIAKSEEETELNDEEITSLLSIIKYHPSALAAGRVTEVLKKQED